LAGAKAEAGAGTMIPVLATSVVVQGLLTTVIPLAAFLGVFIWYLALQRRHYPD
jgi:hypothetical protein